MAQSLCNSNFLVRSGWKDNVIRAIVTDDTRKEQFAGIGPRLVGGKVTIIARQHFRMTPFCRTTIPLIIWGELVKYKDDFSHWVQICFIQNQHLPLLCHCSRSGFPLQSTDSRHFDDKSAWMTIFGSEWLLFGKIFTNCWWWSILGDKCTLFGGQMIIIWAEWCLSRIFGILLQIHQKILAWVRPPPFLAMPRFSRRLLHQPLPYHCVTPVQVHVY